MSTKRGYQVLWKEFFHLCREITDARVAKDPEAKRYLAERIQSRLFNGLTDASKEKAFNIFGLTLHEIEEATSLVEMEPPKEEAEELPLGECFEIVERMERHYAA
jgi:hypothetical protein